MSESKKKQKISWETALKARKRNSFRYYARYIFQKMKKDGLYPELLPPTFVAKELKEGLGRIGISVRTYDAEQLAKGWKEEATNYFQQKAEFESRKKAAGDTEYGTRLS